VIDPHGWRDACAFATLRGVPESTMPTVFLTHTPDMLANYYGERALAALRKLAPVKLNETGRVLDARALAEAARGCTIIISDRQTAAPAAFFPLAADLVAFLRVAVDIRNVDVAAASAQGILVTHATPGFAASVAEMALGYMVDCARHITQSTLEYRAGTEAEPRMGRQLKGATLGIIGYGAIGEYLAPLGVALGMSVLVSDPFKTVTVPGVRQVALPELLKDSDYVVCLVVANEETESLMNAAAFAQMKRSAYFINLSRGNLVDEAALVAALNARQIAGAAMDVGRAPDQKPSLLLAGRADVIATPHTAGLTPEAAEHQAFDTVGQVADLLAGRMPAGAANAEAAHRLARLART
jgi:D-3-phosphoglycerate dehydrogenase